MAKNDRKQFSIKVIVPVAAILLLCFLSVYIYHAYRWYSTFDMKCQKQSEKVLRQVIAEQLGKNPDDLVAQDFAEITTLNIEKKQLYDIELLKECYKLQKLTFRDITIPQINSPVLITALAKLKVVRNPKRVFIELKILENLIDLEVLRIHNAPFGFLDSISGVYGLKVLTLNYMSISNIEFLKSLPNLETLSLNGNMIFDIGPLAKIRSLKNLCIDHTQIRDIKALQTLSGLEILSINNTQISDLLPIANLSKLRHLDIMGDFLIQDLEPIKNISNLEYLCIQNTNISDLEPVKNLKNLKTITIDNCKNISDKQIEDLQKTLPGLDITKTWTSFNQAVFPDEK